MTQPQLAATPLPADGQSIELPLPLPVTLPGKVKLGVFGNHIALFTGDKAEALTTSLGKQELKANGFVHMGIDYTLVADALGLALQQKEAELKQQLADAAAAPADEQPAATEEGMILAGLHGHPNDPDHDGARREKEQGEPVNQRGHAAPQGGQGKSGQGC